MNLLESKYLSDNPINWLLENSDPSIQYLVHKEILEDTAGENLYERIVESSELRRLFNNSGNLLGTSKNLDLFYHGALWCFAEAVERGLDKRSAIIRDTADFITSRCQSPNGGFTLQWKPGTELSCRTGDMIRFLIRAGFIDERIQLGITWISDHQRHDGGWLHCPLAGLCDQFKLVLFNRPGNGLRREADHQVTSCIYATAACAMALVDHRIKTGSRENDDAIRNAADFFLKRSLFKNSKGAPIAPRQSWNHDFRLLGYPIMSQFDILYGMLFIAKAGFIVDRRAGEAFNIIMSKQNNDGTWNMENAQTGMMNGNEPKKHIGKKSKWVTLQVMRLLKHHGGK